MTDKAHRTVFTVTFDVSDLEDEEQLYLAGEVIAQGERSEGHGDVPVLRVLTGTESRITS